MVYEGQRSWSGEWEDWYSQIGTGTWRQYIRKAGTCGDNSWVMGGGRYRENQPYKEGEGAGRGRLCCKLWAPLRETSSLLAVGVSSWHSGILCSGWVMPPSWAHNGALLAGTITEVPRLKGDS